MNNIGGYAGWRWHVKSPIVSQHYADNPRVFIIEGLFTILLAITSFFLIVPLPENVTFLTPSEKTLLLKRLEGDQLTATSEDKTPLTLSQIIKTMTHWKIVLPFVPLPPPPSFRNWCTEKNKIASMFCMQHCHLSNNSFP
jgi:hypothetical protein